MFYFTAKSKEELEKHWKRIFSCDLDSLPKKMIYKSSKIMEFYPDLKVYIVECFDIYNCLSADVRSYEVYLNPHTNTYSVTALTQ